MAESGDYEQSDFPRPLHDLSDEQLLDVLRKIMAPKPDEEFDVDEGLVAFYAAQQAKARLN